MNESSLVAYTFLIMQVLELEANGNDEAEEDVDDVDDELALEPIQSPGSWKTQFEQQRALIFELWDSCNVSIIHRTQFYLLFKGEPNDSIYMEVELRRLTWLQENYNAEALLNQQNANAVEEQLIPTSPNCSNRLVSSPCTSEISLLEVTVLGDYQTP